MSESRLNFGKFGAGIDWQLHVTEDNIADDNHLTLCFAATNDFGIDRIHRIDLTDEAINTIATNKEEFQKDYGEYLCTSVRKEQVLYLFIDLENLSSVSRRSIIASLGGEVNAPKLIDGHFKYSVKAAINELRKREGVTIDVYSFGNNSFDSIPKITSEVYSALKDSTARDQTYWFDRITTSLMNYVNSNFSRQNASTTEFNYTRMPKYKDSRYFNRLRLRRFHYKDLLESNERYLRDQRLIRQIENSKANDLVNQEDRAYLFSTKQQLTSILADFFTAIDSCETTDCVDIERRCAAPTVSPFINANKIRAVANKYLNPFKSYELPPTPLTMDLNLVGDSVIVFEKESRDIDSLIAGSLDTAIRQKIKFSGMFRLQQPSIEFWNGYFTLWINNDTIPIRTNFADFWIKVNNILNVPLESPNPIPLDQKFSGERINRIRIVMHKKSGHPVQIALAPDSYFKMEWADL